MKNKKLGKILAMLLTLTMLFSMIPAMAAEAEQADSVYLNGNIYTVDEAFSKATALAVKGDRLVYVGDDAGVAAYIGTNTKVVDLGGKTVIPGLVEGHMHVTGLGNNLMVLDVFWKPKQVILDLVAEAAATAKPGEWIQGRGWMNTVWEDTAYPTKEDLDAVAPNNPVYLRRADGHMGWANSAALELAGITKDTPDPKGGEYLKTPSGELLGCMTDTAETPIRQLIPAFTVEQQRDALLKAQEQLFSYGITSAMEAGQGIRTYEDIYGYLYEKGQLKLRVYGLISHSSATGETADYLRANPIDPATYTARYNNHLDLRAVKLYSDGSLGARSAAMLEEYSDRPGHFGNYRYEQSELDSIVKVAYDSGYQMGSHAIGDGANNQLLNAYEKAMTANPREDTRLRVEHYQILTPADIDRTIAMGVLPSMQTTHATSDMLMAEDRVGAERIKSSYAWRTLIDKGAIIINGSDAPVELVNPYHGLYAAVTRTNRLGSPKGGWYINEAMTREEALRSFTIWPAYGEFNEDIKGSLEAGKLADFVVLDRDYMTCPEEYIKDIQAVMTVSGGEVVYTMNTSVPTIMWNGLPLIYNSKIVVESGTIYVPLNDTVNGMSAKRDGTQISIGEQSAEVTVRTIDGVEYVGVRALFEGLGRNVTWTAPSNCVAIGWLK